MKQVLRRAGISKQGVAEARLWAERTSLALGLGTEAAERPRILCYHSVGTPEWGVNDVSPQTFRRHIEIALELGYEFVQLEDIVAGRAGPKSLAVTFDDGLRSVLTHGVPILRHFNIPSTLFVVTSWLDGENSLARADLHLSWQELEKLANVGVSLGSHSVTHPSFTKLTRDLMTYELAESQSAIERHLGIKPDAFAIPMGGSRDWSEEASQVAHSLGYKTLLASSENLRSPGTIARTFVTRRDGERVFRAALAGKLDDWEEWVWW